MSAGSTHEPECAGLPRAGGAILSPSGARLSQRPASTPQVPWPNQPLCGSRPRSDGSRGGGERAAKVASALASSKSGRTPDGQCGAFPGHGAQHLRGPVRVVAGHVPGQSGHKNGRKFIGLRITGRSWRPLGARSCCDRGHEALQIEAPAGPSRASTMFPHPVIPHRVKNTSDVAPACVYSPCREK